MKLKKDNFFLIVFIFVFLVNLVPLMQFLLRIPPVVPAGDLVANKTIIGTPFGNPVGGVYEVLYTAGPKFFNNQDPYDIEAVLKIDERGRGFLYPPLAGIIGTVLAKFKLMPGYLIWIFLLSLSVVYFASLTVQHVPIRYRLITSLAIILSTPLIRQVRWGHFMPLAALFTFMVFHFAKKKSIIAGVAAGLASALFYYTGILWIYLFLKKQYKSLALAILIFASTFIPLIYNNVAALSFWKFNLTAGTFPFTRGSETKFFSLHRLFYEIHPKLQLLYLAFLFAILAYVTLRYLSRWSRLTEHQLDLYYIFSVVMVLMIDTWLSEHHMPILLAALVVMVGKSQWSSILPWLYITTNLYMWLFNISTFGYSPWTIIRALGVLGCFVYVLWLMVKENQKKQTVVV